MNFNFSGEISSRYTKILLFVLVLVAGGAVIAATMTRRDTGINYSEVSPADTNQLKKAQTDSVLRTILFNAQGLFNSKNYEQALIEYQKALKIRPNDANIRDKIEKAKANIAQQKKTDAEYTKAIASADAYFNAKDWLNAKSAYQLALDVKPGDPYASGKMKETMDLLRSQKGRNVLYDMAVAGAEKLYQAKEYEKAKAEFEKALQIIPGDKYSRDKINEIIKIQVDLQTREDAYSRAVASGDKFYNLKNWKLSLQQFKDASVIKPDEQYPKDRITELAKLLKIQQETDDAYIKAIADADARFNAASYQNARTAYENAGKIKPDENYPKKRIQDIDDILAAKKRVDEQYQRLVDIADSLYIGKDFVRARDGYQQALGVKSGESYPKEMISKCDNMIAGLEANSRTMEEQYAQAIASGDKLLASKAYEDAKIQFQAALKVKPDEQYPKDKITEIDKALEEIAKLRSLDDQYAQAVASGDKLQASKTYDQAKAKFQAALKIKPGEQYPKDKIAEIDKILADIAAQKSIDDQYARAIASGDKLQASKAYDQAKIQFQAALNIKPDEQYPKDKIAEIDRILADIAAKNAIDEQYAQAIASGDRLQASKSYGEAKNQFQAALNIKPNEQYPKNKIADIDKILADIAAQKSIDDQYAQAIAAGDKLQAEKAYEQAKIQFQSALKLKPVEQYPKDKITEIDKILADIAARKSLDDQYAQAIASGDRLQASKSWEEAKAQFQSALKLKPDEVYPKDKIAEIDKILADIAARKSLDDQYAQAIASGDRLQASKSWEEAKIQFQSALKIKPGEQYPKDKITEIDKILADITAQKAIDDQYAQVIASGDRLNASKEFDQAKIQYQAALKLKPTEQYPKDKITEIDKILADIAAQKALDDQYAQAIASGDKLGASKEYEQAKIQYEAALKLKPAEQYPKDKITEIDKVLADIAAKKAIDDQYAQAIASGDRLQASKSWEEAKVQFQAALKIKPGEQYPRDKISEIDKALTDIAAKKAIDDQYTQAIASGDKLLAEKTYDQAKVQYQSALKIKPNEQYPKDKILEIENLLAEMAKQKILDDQYMQAIASGDRLQASKAYDQAKIQFQVALKIKPDEQYPKDRISKIETLLAEIRAKEEAYKVSVMKADQLFDQKSYDEARSEYQNAGTIKPDEAYPKNRIAEINRIQTELLGKKRTYDNLVQKGDELLATKDYYKAKDNYQQASGIFPDETYPKQKIYRINVVIDSMFRANKGSYDKAVTEGDKAFNALMYDKAIDSYTEALSYLPIENYPKEMIGKIKRFIAENAIVDVLNTTKVINDGDQQRFPFAPVNMASRKNNFVYVKIRNLSERPFNVLVRYGRDDKINGGFVLKNLPADGMVNDRLISLFTQDPWYREDNNWISIYPQGGNVEVSFIQISRVQQ